MLKSLEINGFKSFGSKSELIFDAPKSVIVGPNGSGKSNAAEAFRFVLGEQSLKTLRARNSDELLFNGGQEGRRANRASVKAVFDNTNRDLDIEYGEVVVERIVERGDASKYRINGSRVRLKDVVDLLSDANIGTSRHHIISQGEADKVLNINELERKSLIEDALGLQRFYRKRREAVQKLERTDQNLQQVRQRRRDLEPELSYLKKQERRIEETKKLRSELTRKYQEFFKREKLLISHQVEALEKTRQEQEKEVSNLSQQIASIEKNTPEKPVSPQDEKDTIQAITREIHSVADMLSATVESLGRVDGQIEALQRQSRKHGVTQSHIRIPTDTYYEYEEKLKDLLASSATDDGSKVELIDKFRKTIQSFLQKLDDLISDPESVPAVDNSQEIEKLEKEKERLSAKKKELTDKRVELESKKEEEIITARKQESKQHEADKELLMLRSKKENTEQVLKRTINDLATLHDRNEDVEDEKAEARILCGTEALETDNAEFVDINGEVISKESILNEASNRRRHAFHHQLERTKIKLEETRVSDEQTVLQELDRVRGQVDFLDNEMEDLQNSQDALLTLISEIEETVTEKFHAGVKEINAAFADFFKTMFGGGSAELFITKHPTGKKDEGGDEEGAEEGVGINIQLPNKKVRGLGVLSGGERSLVSIALLFALSQINPPPFVVLDEADAALDEANSRRFGEMIDRLASRSQLIIITHNRETMTRADILYGVTMDQAGGSRLLSLNFSEAVETVGK